jgi:ABC-2 type transport system ATP-binding protein
MLSMIDAQHLSKRYGERLAVDDLTFTVQPGVVTGFLGPNGAGKSTTMRMILGLDTPTSGRVTVNGKAYRDLAAPLHEIGAMLEARAIHTGRSAYNHLLAMAQTHGIPRRRVDEVIDMVGLQSVARKRAGGFSLGMGQRLGIASALLGDPRTVILDEIALTAEHVIVVGRGKLIADTSVAEIVAQASQNAAVRVRTPEAARLRDGLAADGATVTSTERDVLEVHGLESERIGEIAAAQRVILHELTPQKASLEDAYMALTGDSVEYRATEPHAELEHAA